MRRRVSAPLLFSLLSVALHLVWVVYLPAGSTKNEQPAPLVELELASVEEPAPAAVEPQAPAPDPTPSPATPTPSPAPRRPKLAPAPSSLEVAQPSPAPARVEAPEPTLAPQPAQVAVATPPVLNLSARAAALTLNAAVSDVPAARCSAERAAQSPATCAASDAAAAQATLDRNLHAAASSIPHLKTREKPVLKPRPDGSYDYDGHVYQAHLLRDGQVEFADNATHTELRPSLIPFKVTGDISDFVQRSVLGKELYSAEKLWFLDQTRELREKLASAFRLEEAARARRELEKQLQHILEDRALDAAHKHGALFALWQDCGDDAQAEATRRQVESFVQRFMPRGSELGFTQDELERLNAQRAGMRPFRPYPS